MRYKAKLRNGHQSGFSLVEIIIVLGLLGMAAVMLMTVSKNFFDSNKSNLIRTEASDIKSTVAKMLSCEKTFESYGNTRPISCSGNIPLLNKSGTPVFSGGTVGNWTVEAKCEFLGNPARNGISIYITQRRPDGTFKKDPFRNIPLDESHPVSSLYLPDLRPCRAFFENPGAAIACPDGIGSVDFQNNSFDCLPACQYVEFWDARGIPPYVLMGPRGQLSGIVVGMDTPTGPVTVPDCPAGTSLRTRFLSGAREISWSFLNGSGSGKKATVYQYTKVCCSSR